MSLTVDLGLRNEQSIPACATPLLNESNPMDHGGAIRAACADERSSGSCARTALRSVTLAVVLNFAYDGVCPTIEINHER